MSKQRGYADSRGMGAQSDFTSESFVPSERHVAEQMARAKVLLTIGCSPDQASAMLSLPLDRLSKIELPRPSYALKRL